MTSMLPEEGSGAMMTMKQKIMNGNRAKEEARSFLGFSRENLSISHSDLEQGFSKPWTRPSWNTILSVGAFAIALLCLGLETWRQSCSMANAREIEHLKRNVEDLRHWFLEQNTMDVLEAFEEQLYAEESSEDNDPGEADIENADYDSDYDDDSSESRDYSGDDRIPLTYGSEPSDASANTSTSTSSSPDSDIPVNLTATSRKAEMKYGREKDARESHNNTERERLREELVPRIDRERIDGASSAKRKRDVLARENVASSPGRKEGVKRKRSLNDRASADYSTEVSNTRHGGGGGRHHAHRRTIVSRSRSYASDESRANDDLEANSTPSTVSWDGHPPKKYYAHARPETHDAQLSEETARFNRRASEETESVGGGGGGWRNAYRNATTRRAEIRRLLQVYAIHYGADSTLFSAEDEHTGNGRARHGNGVFKAWRPSDWVAELGMSRHFALADGRLTVHEPGLYLAYAQIHYLDEHDENGFHLLVNGRPILQCMVYSPGAGHKSRSCFSAQVTFLQAGDHLVLKDVGSARYTLFQHDKSFFGLAKLGEPRQRHQS